ncbi:MAG: hypothetical protein JOZ02_18100 [Acidobacteria bacterium]|nr:hypothetical protein [Acidobacteriota bacterium]
MRIIILTLTITLTFVVGGGLGAATPASNSSGRQSAAPPAAEGQPSDAFTRELRDARAKRKASAILLTPQSRNIRPRLMNLAWGRLPVLSLPVTIKNSSAHDIRWDLAHEWYGGIWPPTDLYVAVRPAGGGAKFWSNGPGYLVGEKASADNLVTLKPGETRNFDIRLNWRGTGSVPFEPLIDESKPGRYSIKFLLFFKADGSEEYLESQAAEIEVEN